MNFGDYVQNTPGAHQAVSFYDGFAQAKEIVQMRTDPLPDYPYWEDRLKGVPLTEQVRIVDAALTLADESEQLLIKQAAGWVSIGLFAKYFFSEYISESFGNHHEPIFEAIQRGERGKRINILAPRGSGKSTIVCRIIPLHTIYYKEKYAEIDAEDHFIVIISNTFRVAQGHLRAIKTKVERDPLFGHLQGPKWGEMAITTSNETYMIPLGMRGQVRGSLERENRPSLILADDAEDYDSLRNPDIREKNLEWWDRTVVPAQELSGERTNFWMIDTRKHIDALPSTLETRPAWKTYIYRAVEHPEDVWHPTAERLWKEWEQVYSDMSVDDTEREARAEKFYQEHKAEMTEGVEMLWEDRLPYLKCRQEIVNSGYLSFLQEFQQVIKTDELAVFDMKNAVRFEVNDEGLLRDDGRLVLWDAIVGYTAALDWAGAKDIADNCYAVGCVVLWESLPGGRRENLPSLAGTHGYVLNAFVERMVPQKQIERTVDLYLQAEGILKPHQKNARGRFVIEDFIKDATGYQKQGVKRDFDNAKAARDADVPFAFVSRNRNKFDRIETLASPIARGWLCFNRSLPPLLFKQFSEFPTGQFVDAPDAVELATTAIVTENRDAQARRNAEKQRARQQRLNLHRGF